MDSKHAGGVKTELIRKLLERFNAAPDRVKFSKSDAISFDRK